MTSPDAVLSPEFVVTITASYVIEELTKVVSDSAKLEWSKELATDGGEQHIERILKNSNHRLRMYGTARELAENANIFCGTPGAWRRFNSHGYRVYPYYTTPIMFKSLKDEEYICKQDVYLILQNMTMNACPFEKSQVLRVLITLYLRSREVEHFPKVEFMKYDKKVFEELNEEIKEQMKHFMNDLSKGRHSILQLSNNDFYDVCEKFRNLIPIEWDDSLRGNFNNILGDYIREFADSSRLEGLITLAYNATGGIVEILKRTIDNRSEIFKDRESRFTLRLFEDGDERFVVKEELMEAISGSRKTGSIYKKGTEIIDTMSMEDVEKNYGERIQDFEFIRTPILRAKHRAVPIPIHFGDFGILAADALLEFLRNVIFGLKLFQRQESEVLQEFGRFDKLFKSETKDLYFINTLADQVLNEVCTQLLDDVDMVPAKDVRNAKKDGFTVQNLKNELAHLNLTRAFPEIQNHAEIVYAEVDKMKKEQFLRTCDLFDAIEHCQLICIFERLPNLKKFLHNQKSCHRVIGLPCSICRPSHCKKGLKIILKTTKCSDRGASEFKKFLESHYQKTSTPESKKCEEKASEVVKKTSKASECKKAALNTPKRSESQNSQETTSASESPNQKTSPKFARESQSSESQNSQMSSTTLAPESQKPSESPNQKTSANCEKCHRTCERLNETKKELKSSENKLKNLEKKLVGKEREMEELKKNQKGKMVEKEVQRLKKSQKEEVDKKEKEIQALNDLVSNLKSSVAQAKNENLRQKEQFKSTQDLLEEKVLRLEQELVEEKMKRQKMSDEKKEILEKNRRIKELEGSEKIVQEKEEENQNLNSQISNLKFSMVQVEEENLRQKEQFISTQNLLEEKVLRLEQELVDEKMKALEMNQKMENLEIVQQLLQKEIQMKSEEIQGWKDTIQKKEEENRNLTGYISDLESYLAHAKEEESLKERVFRLEQELREGNENMWELQNQMASDEAQFDAYALEKDREIQEWKEWEIRMKAENEVNQRMIQQLMDKLASSGVSSGVGKNSEVPTTSSRIQKCEICWNETSDREAVRCQKCRKPFHQKCSSQWLKSYKKCPSCDEEFLESTNTQFSEFS